MKITTEKYNEFILFAASEARNRLTERLEQGAEDRESKAEANKLARDWADGFTQHVAEDKAQTALTETLGRLHPQAAMTVCREMAKVGPKRAWTLTQQIRGEEATEEQVNTITELVELSDILHAELSGLNMRAQQAQYGRRTAFNAYLFRELALGWIVTDEEADPVPYTDTRSFLEAMAETAEAREQERVSELREAKRQPVDFSAFV